MDNAARIRLRGASPFPAHRRRALYKRRGTEPKGTDQVLATTATALKVLAIAAKHPSQLYVAGAFALSGLGAEPSRMRRSPPWPETADRPSPLSPR